MINDLEVAEPARESLAVQSPETATPNGATNSQQEKICGAIVLGGDYRALTVVRSLGRHRIPVWVCPEQQKIATKSRYALKQSHCLAVMRTNRSISCFALDSAMVSTDGYCFQP